MTHHCGMNSAEAKLILARELAKYRSRPFDELLSLIQQVETHELTGASGACYQLEFQALWEDPRSRKVLRVSGAIDEGGPGAFAPLTDGFRITPAGKFVGG
jgi:hypothetical protein